MYKRYLCITVYTGRPTCSVYGSIVDGGMGTGVG